MWKNVFLIIILLSIGFLIGRKTVKYETKVKYVEGKEIHDTITNLVPCIIEVPVEPEEEYIDTAKIIEDYFSKKVYSKTIFDNDTIGKMTINTIVKNNELKTLDYQFVPVYRQVTNYRTKKYMPFVTTSVNSLGVIGTGVGAYKNGYGIELKFVTDFNKKGIELGLHYKF